MKDGAVCALCGVASKDSLVVLRQPICGRCEEAITHLGPDCSNYPQWIQSIKFLWWKWLKASHE